MKMSNQFVAAALVVAGAAVMSSDAQADTISRVFASNATNACQSALPVYDTSIRKRPLAFQNEGTTSAFVTCSFQSQGAAGFEEVDVWFFNNNADAVTVECTGVTGYQDGVNRYQPKSVVVAPGEQDGLYWIGEDFVPDSVYLPSALLSVSCVLPPNVGINDTYVFFDEEVGTVPAPAR